MKTKRHVYKKRNRTRKKRRTMKLHRRSKTIGGDLNPDIKNIVKRLIQDRENNMGRMLNVACKNPGNCLALGAYGSYIKQYFENFRNLSLVDTMKMKRIGSVSSNGFIVEMPFIKNNFTAYTALKCAADAHSDNLFYEYYVGKFFINKYFNIFPCFVETYDCYRFINGKASWTELKDLKNKNNMILTDIINRKIVSEERITSRNNHDNEDSAWFKMSCVENKDLSVLIQHFDNFHSVHDELRDNIFIFQHEIFNILYQVYFPLTILKDVYTHYDLHADNVFLYKPYEGDKYIQMRYHLLSGRIIEFPSEYIVKIIDYGRNYFNNGMTNTRKIIRDYIRNNDLCNPDCGFNVGYGAIQGNECDPNTDFHWVFPNKKNISHDLRFAFRFFDLLKIMFKAIDVFVYGGFPVTHKGMLLYGTPEKLGGNSRTIYNIVNLRDCIEENIDKYNMPTNQKYDATWKKVAIMDIYEDQRPYTYEVLPDTA